jgi:hypothetical protein
MKRYFVLAIALVLVRIGAQALDREAFTITSYQLEARIDRESHVMAVTGRLKLRNDSNTPEKNVTLQVSSSLAWNGVALNGKPVEWIASEYTSDIDHTGSLSEAIVTLPKPVSQGAQISLDVQYGGAITPNANRFTRMGMPPELALRNDWDQISPAFTAVRGLGNVVWYPVSIPAVSMSEGATVFAAIDAWKARHRDSQFEARIRVVAGDAKLCIAGTNMASHCGDYGTTPDPRSEELTNEVSNAIRIDHLANTSPSFAVAEYVRLERPGLTVFHVPAKTSVARDYAAAAELNDPVLNDWLPQPVGSAIVIELTDPNANPFQSGPLLFTPLRESDQATLSELQMPAQVAARFSTARPWINAGMQRFLQAVSVERRAGRKSALQFLNEYLPAIVKAEEPAGSKEIAPKGPSENSAADSLINSSDEILLRGKSSYVFWMLRDMVGDSVLQHALAAYRSENDKSPAYFQGLLEQGGKHSLEWFFDDWVYRDRGLPNFQIANVYARPVLEDPEKLNLVTVTLENRGSAGAEVPVILQSAAGERTIRVVVPAHQTATVREQIPGSPTHVLVNDGSVPVTNPGPIVYEAPLPK